MKQFLLVLVTIALAAAPLRTSFAMPVPAAAEQGTHCAHMQDGMQAMGHAAGLHDPGADKSDHGCNQGCTGDCCDGACGTCGHAPVAVPAAAARTALRYSRFLPVPAAQHFAGRTVHPPFRPPILFS